MLNWIVWNGTVFDIETVLTQNWIVIYIELFWHLIVCKQNVLILNWISSVWINWIAWNTNVFNN